MNSIDDIPIQPDRQKKRPVGQMVSVAISVVALAVSGSSFWQSLRNAALQRELARPLLQISNGSAMPYLPDSDWRQAFFSVRAQNIGHLTAFLTEATFTSYMVIDIPKKLPQACLDEMHKKVSLIRRVWRLRPAVQRKS